MATTRAETMLGDTAVAVHPDDERYRHLIGTEVELPLTGRRIPIVADEHVDPAFGTGAVKVTPAHDPNDFEIGQRHDLPQPDDHGRARRHHRARPVPGAGPVRGPPGDRRRAARAGPDRRREAARTCTRSGTARAARPPSSRGCRCSGSSTPARWPRRPATRCATAGCSIEPAELAKRYFAWVDNMHDWCISRQLWWGHRIPVWYGPDGEIVCVGPDERAARPARAGARTRTCSTPGSPAALWPFSTLGWPEQTPDLAQFYPTSVLVTGYDILFFWVARMMMFGLYAMDGQPPFDVVALHGMVRDEHGKKMSKSFGNVVDPLDWIDRFGADATRFTLARGANPGADVPVSEEWCQGSRNFCNKLWNATRFALMNGAHSRRAAAGRPSSCPPSTGGSCPGCSTSPPRSTSSSRRTSSPRSATLLYHFAWDDVCDWYVELAKPVLAAGGEPADVTRRVLGHVLDQLLRLLHPVIPFVTDELWTALTGGETVHDRRPGRRRTRRCVDDAAEAEIAALQRVVTEVRRFRSDQGLRPGQRVAARLDGLAGAGIAAHEPLIRSLARLDDGRRRTSTPRATLAGPGGVSVALDTRGAIDVAAERARLDKDRAAAEKEAGQARAKLGNPAFVGKAPEPVVAKIQRPAGRGRGRPGPDRRRPGGAAARDRVATRVRRGRRRSWTRAASPGWSST